MSALPFKPAARPADCPSDLALDRLQAGELPAPQEATVRAHAAACASCAARLAERAQGFAALPVDERKLLAAIRRGVDEPAPGLLGGLFTRARAGLAALTAVAALAAVVVMVRAAPQSDADVRAKGGLALHVFREHAGKVVAAMSGDKLASGDRLRFVADLPSAGVVRVLGVEESGALYTAWPLDATMTTRFARGDGISLPGAVRLDDSAGPETLYLVHCPIKLADPGCRRGEGKNARPICAPGCNLTPFPFEKAR